MARDRRHRAASAGAAIALLLAGCGDDDGGGGEAGIDCGPTEDALGTLDAGIRVILQLEFPHVYEEVVSGERPFDPDAFLAAVETLRPLEAVDISDATESFGTTADALALYAGAGEAAAETLAADDPFATGEAERLKDAVGPVATFVTPQHGLRLAAERAGCDPPELQD